VKCPKCETKELFTDAPSKWDSHFCPACEKRWTAWQQSEIDYLKAELAKYKLTWQTGEIPKDGWYWMRYKNDIGNWMLHKICHIGTHYMTSLDLEWSGPIPEPEEK
jgi:hypothetical protein